jgi:hypothetical protein
VKTTFHFLNITTNIQLLLFVDKDDHHNFYPVLLLEYLLPALPLSGTWNKKLQQYIVRHYNIKIPIFSYTIVGHSFFFGVHFTVRTFTYPCFTDDKFLTSTLFCTLPFINLALITINIFLLLPTDTPVLYQADYITSDHITKDLQGLAIT